MSDLVPFAYEDFQVRTVLIDGEPWFVAADACAVLALRDTSSALKMVDPEDLRRLRRSDTPQFFGGIAPQVQEITVVNESGLYALIFHSRKPEARKFKRWVTHELIPAVRKTGRYEVGKLTHRELAQMVIEEADRADAAESKVAELEPKLEAVEARSEEQRREIIKSQAPLNYLRTHVDPRNDTTTFTIFAKQLGLRTAHQLYEYLIAIDVIWKRVQGRRWTSKGGEEIVYQYVPHAGYEHWFKMLDQVDAPTLHNGQQPTTLYVLPPGKVGIAEKLTERPIETVLPPSNVTKLPKRGRKKSGGAA